MTHERPRFRRSAGPSSALLSLVFCALSDAAFADRIVAPQVRVPVTFELQESVTAKGERLMLGEVATCVGLEAICAEAYGVDLGPAPGPGQVEYLRRDELQKTLSREWPSIEVVLSGAALVKLSGPAGLLVEEEIERALEQAVAARFEGHADLRARVVQVQVTRPPRVFPGEYRLEFPELSSMPKGKGPEELSLDWVLRRLAGRQTLEVIHVPESGAESTRFNVASEIEIERRYPVAARNLARGEAVRKDDLVTAFKSLRRGQAPFATESSELIGKRLKRPVMAGEPIRLDQVEVPLAIRRGQMVKLVLERGGLAISGYVKALENGRYGETISVIYPKTAKRIDARVVDSSTVVAKL